MTIPIKPAATVILMREAKKGDFEIFMVKRSSRPPFGSLYVFPGGKLDPEDSDNDLYPCCEGMDDAAASRQLGIKDNGLAYWIACIRECFEEVGILLTGSNNLLIQDTHKLNALRNKLNNKEITFRDICLSESLNLRAKNIVPCAHWITPIIEPKRFDTRFFLAKVDIKQLARHDGFELTESTWIKPQDALKKLEKGKMNMIIPTIENIKALAKFSSSNDAFNYFDSLKDEEIPPILPKFIKKDGDWIGFLPGDEGYDNV
jgi:8-oxo-dGTP pyrophosphatase MutT (NUDIX family)